LFADVAFKKHHSFSIETIHFRGKSWKITVIRAPARDPATSLEGRMTLGQACLEGGHLQQGSSSWVPLTQNVVGKSLNLFNFC